MNIRTALIASTLAAAGLLSGAAHAALQGRDLDGNLTTFEAFYDTDPNITWLADANYAKTGGYDADGLMQWNTAKTWANALVIVDSIHNITYNNWKLPSTLQPDSNCGLQAAGVSFGFGCTGSDMGYLFYTELGGTAGQSILGSVDPDLAKFAHIQTGKFYWSEIMYLSLPGYAWYFHMGDGSQNGFGWGEYGYAWAVSPGDVGLVPEAHTYGLMLAGLGLVGWRARQRGCFLRRVWPPLH